MISKKHLSPVRALLLSSWAVVSVTTVLGATATGCKKDEPNGSAASANASAKEPKPNLAQIGKQDPKLHKEYRLDLCTFGTSTILLARQHYLESVGADGPSEKHLPDFGPAPATFTPPGSSAKPGTSAAKPGAPPSAKPAATAAPKPTATASSSSKAGASASTSAGVAAPPPLPQRIQHERYARACTVAAGVKEPAMAEWDALVAEAAPLTLDLSKDLSVLQGYYQRQEYKTDSFQKGKELHKKIATEQGKLIEASKKLNGAWVAYYKAHPRDATNWSEGQKVAFLATDKGADLVLLAAEGLGATKIDQAAWKEKAAQVEKARADFAAYAEKNASEAWNKVLETSVTHFSQAVAAYPPTDKGVSTMQLGSIVNEYILLIEARQRGIGRSLIGSEGMKQFPNTTGSGIRMPIQIKPPQ